MCGGSKPKAQEAAAPPALVSAPAATNVAQDMEDKSKAAARRESKRAQQYGASKTKTTGQGLGSASDSVDLKRALGG